MSVARHAGLVAALGIQLGACGSDVTPDAFTFTDRTDVGFAMLVESDEVVITGIDQPVSIEIRDGEYSIDGAPYTAADGEIASGQAVRVRVMSAPGYGEWRYATLTVGNVQDAFDVTTVEDVAPPSASIVFPHLDGVWVELSEVVVRGIASDNDQVASVTVNGVEATSEDGFATWQAIVPLPGGQASELVVTVADPHGNVVEAADSITVNAYGVASGRACGAFHYDPETDRMFGSVPLSVTHVSAGTVVRLPNFSDTDYVDSLLYDDVGGRLYAFHRGALAEVDPSDGSPVATLSPEGTNGISLGDVSGATLDRINGIAYAYSDELDAVVSIRLADGTRSIVSGDTVGSGPVLRGVTYLAFGGSRLFAATDRLGDFTASVVFEIDLANGDRTVISGDGAGSGRNFQHTEGLVASSDGSILYVADESGDLLAVDPGNGARTIVSPAIDGLRNNALFESSLAMQLLESSDTLLISDCKHRQLVSIDLGDGSRSILTPPFRGSGPPLVHPFAIALRQDRDGLITLNGSGGNGAVAAEASNLISVDTTTGTRAIVSNAALGSGDAVIEGFDLVDDVAHDRYLVTDGPGKAVVSIHPATGERAILSDNVSHGAGEGFQSPAGIAIDPARNRAVVVDTGLRALVGVDLETGNRTVFSQTGGAGSGEDFAEPVDVELDLANDRAFVTDLSLHAVFRVDLRTGARAIVSGNSVGKGDPLQSPRRIAFDANNDRIAVTHDGVEEPRNSIAFIDPDTGDREFRRIALGFRVPRAMVFEPASGLLYCADLSLDLVFAYDYESGGSVIVSQ